MANLITFADFEGIKTINLNQNQERQLDPSISEAQKFDAKKLLGAAFFQNIIDNPTDPDNLVLLNGTTYDNNQGDPVSFEGLKVMIVYFAFARYVGGKNITDTVFGFVNKQGEKSDQVDNAGISRECKASIAAAFAVWNEIKDFLNAQINASKYDLWKSPVKGTMSSSARITRVGRDRHRHHHHINDNDDHRSCDHHNHH